MAPMAVQMWQVYDGESDQFPLLADVTGSVAETITSSGPQPPIPLARMRLVFWRWLWSDVYVIVGRG